MKTCFFIGMLSIDIHSPEDADELLKAVIMLRGLR